MAGEERSFETAECRLVLVQPDSRKVLLDHAKGYRLPRVQIQAGRRPAEQLQKAVRAEWGLDILILDFLSSPMDSPCCVIAELLDRNTNKNLIPAPAEKIPGGELSEEQSFRLTALILGENKWAFQRIGWIDEAIAWLESATGKKLSSKSEIEQLNAGGPFALVCFHSDDCGRYWLKGVGEPNTHELSITFRLSELCRDYLPAFISSRPSWNAWLMSGQACDVMNVTTNPVDRLRQLTDAVESMAALQMKTVGCRRELLVAGAFDQGIERLQKESGPVFDYLEEAMRLQTSTKVPTLKSSRLRELHALVDRLCRRTQDLELPETIVHGNLTPGNILLGPRHCQFIDWCESYVGSPLIALQHLLLLNKAENVHSRELIDRALKQSYRDAWAEISDPAVIEAGFRYMPLLAIVSSLVGRGDWLSSPKRNDPQRQSYARSLARYMDRAAYEPELMEALSQ